MCHVSGTKGRHQDMQRLVSLFSFRVKIRFKDNDMVRHLQVSIDGVLTDAVVLLSSCAHCMPCLYSISHTLSMLRYKRRTVTDLKSGMLYVKAQHETSKHDTAQHDMAGAEVAL